MTSISITVIMSVRNGERYIKKAVDSVLAQTFGDFEFIIINDASTDETKEILKKFSDPRIKIIENRENIGLTKSLNLGLKQASGKYIARMDADDISLPNRFEIEKKFLDDHPEIACVGGETEIINEEGEKIGAKKIIGDPEIIRFRMIFANQMAHPTIMIRKSVIVGNGGYDEDFRYVQDYELWSRLTEKGFNFANIPTPLIKYRYHPMSLTQATESRETAYSFAASVIKRNISRYMRFSDDDFSFFLKSFHKHQVCSFKQVFAIRKFWLRLGKAYEEKEKISPKAREAIYSHIKREHLSAFRWYIRCRFGTIYRMFAKIKQVIANKK